jgi:hypothetical protein
MDDFRKTSSSNGWDIFQEDERGLDFLDQTDNFKEKTASLSCQAFTTPSD